MPLPVNTETGAVSTGECDCCGYEVPVSEIEFVPAGFLGPRGGDLCLVCRSTKAGNAFCDPDHYPGQLPILGTIAWGINHLAEIVRTKA